MTRSRHGKPQDDKTSGADLATPRRRPPYSREMTIEGILLHARAIIEQGRTEEFLKACRTAGFHSLTGPDDLIAFTRAFILSSAPVTGLEATTLAPEGRFTTVVRELDVSHIDCP